MARKILLINWRDIRNPEAGGAETYYHEIFRRLNDGKEFDITVLSHTFSGGSAVDVVDGMRVIRLGSRTLFNYQIIPFLRRHHSEYDLVIEDLNKIPFFTPLYVRNRRLHLVMHFFGKTIFREIAVPMAAYVYLMEKLVPLVYRKERFVAISESTRSDIAGWNSRVDVVEPGIDTGFFRPVEPKSDSPVLLYVGRLKKYKNVQFVIECMPQILARVPETKLIVAGSGDYASELQALVTRLNIEKSVEFTGYVTEEQKRALLSQATVMVNPSVKEGWGITNIEANLCGTVSVSQNVHGLRDSVQHGKTGLLYNQDDRDDFVQSVERLLLDSDYRSCLERNARPFAESFAWDRVAEKMRPVIQSFFS